MNKKMELAAIVCIASLALTACIGQSSSTEDTPPPKPRNTNTAPTQSTPPDSDAAESNAADQLNVADFAMRNAIHAFAATGPNAALLTTVTNPCLGGGTVTVDQNDVDPVGPSTGDTYKSTFANCVIGARTINGSSEFEIVTLVGDPTQPPPAVWSIDTRAAIDITVLSANFTRASKGEFHFAAGTSDGVDFAREIAGQATQSITTGTATRNEARSDESSLTWNVNTNSYRDTVRITQTGGSGGDLAVETLAPVTGTITPRTVFGFTLYRYNPPTAGSVKVTVTSGSLTTSTTYTGQSDGQAQIDIDTDGNGTIDTTTTGPWPRRVLTLLGLF